MKYLMSDLGSCQQGDVLEVTLTSGANVRLLDSSNFQKYRRGQAHRYQGGLAKRSPVRLTIPSSGHWYGVVDMQGLRGSTNASFRLVPRSALQPLPPIREGRREIQNIAENFAEVAENGDREFDVFISHATEDKDSVVRPLAHALSDAGVSVWYDEFELRIGDSLRRKIDAGIARSRFGLVILSPSFFAKPWPQYELDGLVTMAVSQKQVLLPVWHEVSMDQVIQASPSLADKLALRTADYTIEQIACEIAQVIRPTGPEAG